MHIPDHAAPDEYILDAAQMRVPELVQHGDVVELDVEVLVDGFQGAADGDVIFELHGYGCLDVGIMGGWWEGGEGVLWFVRVLKKLY